MNYLYLCLAIFAEVVATTALKPAAGFTRLFPSLVVFFGYSVSFYLLSLILQTMPIGITYAIWSGLGIVLVTFFAKLIYNQQLDGAALLGIALIIIGVVIIQVFSKNTGH